VFDGLHGFLYLKLFQMSPGVSWTKRNRNKVVPIEDLVSERIEVRPGRLIRVLHFSPQVSTTTSRYSEDRGTVSDSKTSCGRSVSFESQDNQNIIVIFFIHGVGGCAELWSEQLRHFCRAGYAVVAPDLLGHGGSSAPRDQREYEFSELSKDMMTIFDRFSRRRNILVGHSYG
jgi:abhydrolase domain-containing protein 8